MASTLADSVRVKMGVTEVKTIISIYTEIFLARGSQGC